MCLENSSQKTIPQLNETIDSSLNESGSVRLNSISTSLAPSAEASLSYTGYQSADIEAKEENEERGGSYISEYEGVAKATKTLALTNEDEILSGVDVEKVKAEPEISVRFMYFSNFSYCYYNLDDKHCKFYMITSALHYHVE